MEIRIRNDYFGDAFETCNINDLINRLNNGIKPTYEVINDINRYNFDFDYYCKKEDFDLETAEWLENKLENYIFDALHAFTGIEPNIAIATSHTNNYSETEGKYSIRFYITNLMDNKENMKSFVEDLNVIISEIKDDPITGVIDIDNKVFDTSIYSHNKKLRCVNTSKPNEIRPLILKKGNIEDTIVTNVTDCVMVNYVSNRTKPKANINAVKRERVIDGVTETKQEHELTKEQELLYMIRMSDKKDRKMWMRVCSCLKFNNMTNKDWLEFCELNELNMDKEKLELYSKIKTDADMSIHYIQSLAKQSNPMEYREWLKKWNVYYISATQIASAYETSNIIKQTLKHSVVICKDQWYVLNNKQLWLIQKDPTHYIITEIKKYLDYSKDILNYKINNADGDKKKELIKELEDWLKFYHLIEKPSYLNVLTRCLSTTLRDDEFSEKLDVNRGELSFRNGIYDLETNKFRPNIMWSDYITKTIPYDYTPCSDFTFVKSKLKEILNNNDEHLEYFLSIIGYSFCGYADKEKSIYFMIDKTDGGRGDNGKTFFFDILSHLFPCYVYKSKSELIANDNKKSHKQLAKTKGMRLVWLEEMPKEKQTNAELLKYIGDGKPFENEVMFGTCEQINMLFKLFALSNHCPKIDPSELAVYNRYKQVSFNSHFDRTGQRTESIPEELKFIADNHLPQTIKDNYYDEVFNLVIHYAHQYFIRGMPPIPQQFLKDTKETQNKNDEFGSWFDDNCILKSDCKVSLKALISNSGFNKTLVSEGMERKGFKYNKDLYGFGKDANGKTIRGGYIGIEIKDIALNDEV
jgi:phage/plasmid-associated DNA primase